MTRREHHTVSNFYLRRFADKNKRVMTYEKATGRAKPRATRTRTVQYDFYEVPEHLTGSDADIDFVEQILSKAESTFAVAIDSLSKGFPPSDEKRGDVADFVAVQFVRTQQWRRISLEGQGNAYSQMVNLIATMAADDQHLAKQTWDAVSDEEMSPKGATDFFARMKGISVMPEPFAHVQQVLRVLLGDVDYSRFVLDRCWVLLRAAPGCQFLTSDTPVTFIRDPEGPPYVGIRTANVIVLPVDPDHCLVMHRSPGPDRTRLAPRELVDMINQLVCDRAEDEVYGHPRVPRDYIHTCVTSAASENAPFP